MAKAPIIKYKKKTKAKKLPIDRELFFELNFV